MVKANVVTLNAVRVINAHLFKLARGKGDLAQAAKREMGIVYDAYMEAASNSVSSDMCSFTPDVPCAFRGDKWGDC
jgi:hypothetical protein